MKIKISEIAKMLNSGFKGSDIIIEGASVPEKAGKNHLIYIDSSDKAALLSKSNAGCAIVPENLDENHSFKGSLIYSKNPKLSFAAFLALIENEIRKREIGISEKASIDKTAKIAENASIEPFAVISKNASIGENSVIGANSYIGANSKLGKNCLIYPHVIIRENCEIGDNVIIHSASVIGSDGFGYIQTETGHKKIPQIGKVKISDNVEIGALCAIDRATLGETSIGEGTKIDNLVHMAHNVKIGKNCLILAQAGIAGSTTVDDKAIIGGQAGISDHIHIGENAIIMSKTGIISDIKPGAVVFGNVARPHREAMKVEVLISKLPQIYKSLKEIKKKLNLK